MTSEPLTAEGITKDLDFGVGQQYIRKDLHDVCGGNHQPGISPVTDLSAIFLFGSPTKNEPWYEDEWLSDDHFRLTGVGREGNQAWDGSVNKSLANHEEADRRVFLFERVPETNPTVVTYVGEFEYVDHRETKLADVNDEQRQVYQFKLRPVEQETIEVPNDLDELELETLYEKAKPASNGETVTTSTETSGSTNRTDRTTSEVVRQFALREADGVCQGCNKEAPFETESGDPYLEVHHITRVSDGGPDHPDNVIALCPNCHAEVHDGKKGPQLNEKLREKAENRTASLASQ